MAGIAVKECVVMRCEDVQEILDRRELGEEAVALPADVDVHVRWCNDCQEFSQHLESISQAFATVPEQRLSEAASAQIRGKIEALERERLRVPEARPSIFTTVLESLAQLVTGPRLVYGMGAAAVMMAVISAVEFSGGHIVADNQSVQPPITPAPAPIVPLKTQQVKLLSGQVLASGGILLKAGDRSEFPMVPGRVLSAVGSGNQQAVLVLADGTKVAMAGGTDISVGDRQMRLHSGRVAVHVLKQGKGFRTETPYASTLVMGTRYIATGNEVDLVEGKVLVHGSKGQVTLKPGEQANCSADRTVTATKSDEAKVIANRRELALLDTPDWLAKDLNLKVEDLYVHSSPAAATAASVPVPASPATSVPFAARTPRTSGPGRSAPGELPINVGNDATPSPSANPDGQND